MDRYTKDFVIVVAILLALALYWMLSPLWGVPMLIFVDMVEAVAHGAMTP